jgi:hypothetical protein
MLQRRSRMRRTRTGKRIELTARDMEIFRFLARCRYLSSTYIHAFVGGASETRFKERLGNLFHEGYVDRPERQWELADCRHRPVIHEMGEGGRRALDAHGVIVEPLTWLGSGSHRQFSHSLMICEILASLEIGTRQHPGIRYIAWPEILAKAPAAIRDSSAPFRFPLGSGAVVPDALFGIEYDDRFIKTYRFFAVEADRGTMPVVRSDDRQTSYLTKLRTYEELLGRQVYRSHLGLPNLILLTITTSDARLADIIRRGEALSVHSGAFLFKAIGTKELRAPARSLLMEPWPRIGQQSLRIDQSLDRG